MRKAKYISRPRKKTSPQAQNSVLGFGVEISELDARFVMVEKTQRGILGMIENVELEEVDTEIIYPNSTDVILFQSFPNLEKEIFGKDSNISIVRVFLSNKKKLNNIFKDSIKRAYKTIEHGFAQRVTCDVKFLNEHEVAFTGLLAIPTISKYVFLMNIIKKRDFCLTLSEEEQADLEKKAYDYCYSAPRIPSKIFFKMPTMNIAKILGIGGGEDSMRRILFNNLKDFFPAERKEKLRKDICYFKRITKTFIDVENNKIQQLKLKL